MTFFIDPLETSGSSMSLTTPFAAPDVVGDVDRRQQALQIEPAPVLMKAIAETMASTHAHACKVVLAPNSSGVLPDVTSMAPAARLLFEPLEPFTHVHVVQAMIIIKRVLEDNRHHSVALTAGDPNPLPRLAKDITGHNVGKQLFSNLEVDVLPFATTRIPRCRADINPDHKDVIPHQGKNQHNYEQNYSISELECLAIIESIEYFRVFLFGRHFTIYSDHQALVYLKNIKNPSVSRKRNVRVYHRKKYTDNVIQTSRLEHRSSQLVANDRKNKDRRMKKDMNIFKVSNRGREIYHP
ncbi:K02A2.6-like [Cordylochernes scorpioides]|uniref:K02A2.6-like n=1 Tax=Cordylochernes scorpioides TaxID=51811 RepID=A0ABY6KFQ7_9ARAC|nr:K02A2.6-like [Cordylochernes scorpioides]